MNRFSRIGWLFGGLVLLFVVVTVSIYFFFNFRPNMLEDIGLIDTPVQTADRLMLACKQGNAQEMLEVFTNETLSRFYNKQCLEYGDTVTFEEAIDAFAKRQQKIFGNAAFEYRQIDIRQNSAEIQVIATIEEKEPKTFILYLVRGENGRWRCNNRL